MVRESGSWPDEKAEWYCKIDVIACAPWGGEGSDTSKLGLVIALKEVFLHFPWFFSRVSKHGVLMAVLARVAIQTFHQPQQPTNQPTRDGLHAQWWSGLESCPSTATRPSMRWGHQQRRSSKVASCWWYAAVAVAVAAAAAAADDDDDDDGWNMQAAARGDKRMVVVMMHACSRKDAKDSLEACAEESQSRQLISPPAVWHFKD
jgi:hypothetical protein